MAMLKWMVGANIALTLAILGVLLKLLMEGGASAAERPSGVNHRDTSRTSKTVNSMN
jgi:hypothetical protein